MGTPLHISTSASQLFFQNKEVAEYEALSIITQFLVHPYRTLLSTFITEAADRELASRFFLDEVSQGGKSAISDFLADWITLLTKIRPVIGTSIEESVKQKIWQRDGGRCCISKQKYSRTRDENILFTVIWPPTFHGECNLIDDGRAGTILKKFVGDEQTERLRSLKKSSTYQSDKCLTSQIMLLSTRVFEHFRNGRLCLRDLSRNTYESAQYMVQSNNYIPNFHVEAFKKIELVNEATNLALLPNPLFLRLHEQFADAFAWLEVSEYMTRLQGQFLDTSPKMLENCSVQGKPRKPRNSCQKEKCLRSCSNILHSVWIRLPKLLRAIVYQTLVQAAKRFGEDTGSYRMFRLPFNLYLRVESGGWASKLEAESRALQLVNNYTCIPAPTPLDTFYHKNVSFLLMTGLPGRKLGHMIPTLSDRQLKNVAHDLKEYIIELRRIPNEFKSKFQICNALGGGILDWRIGNSKREELKFKNEDEFHRYLAGDLYLDKGAQEMVSKAHNIKHDIVFTHADINLRNILVNKDGKITGIVDWECAGWYPEYWEYTKAHFAVRYQIRWLADVVDQVFSGYRDELYAENQLTNVDPPW